MQFLLTPCFLLLTSITAQRINIEVSVQHKDDAILKAVHDVASAISRDNRYAVPEVIERVCEKTANEDCSSNAISITSLGVSFNGSVDNGTKITQQIERLFTGFVERFYTKRVEKKDDVSWWDQRFPGPHAKHLEMIEKFISESADHSSFILFYRPEGYENYAPFYTCSDLFESQAVRGLLVDCSEKEDLCAHYAISSVPTLMAYHDGKPYKQHTHAIDAEQISDWIKTSETQRTKEKMPYVFRLVQPVITKLTEDAVPYYREGIVPGFESARSSVIIFFAATRKSATYKNYKRFARERHGDYHLTELINQGIQKWAHQPAFVAMKPQETISKANTHYENISYESMADFIEENQYPSLHHLNDMQAVATVLSLDRPLALFFDTTKMKDVKQFATLASDYSARSTLAVFAVNQGLSMPGLFLADHFKIDTATPFYVFFDLKNNCLSTKPIADENEMEIRHWIKNAHDNCRSGRKASVVLSFAIHLRVLLSTIGRHGQIAFAKRMGTA
ncbi:unnamed protein product [Nippostrongylus brasiliensis]|uniref:Thioredoxin domain-containing protein n=1 Tax=Nippostrongylus brasiliensis TaxID=27835 RepID=A0A0N4Y7Q9_NIPBR|nr:unnamed protein product [Nippostrongylus brasiliensis]